MALTCGGTRCLTSCQLRFVSKSCHFFRTPLSVPSRHIQSLGTRANPFGRFRHVTALSQPQLAHSPAWEMNDPAAQCIWQPVGHPAELGVLTPADGSAAVITR